MEDIKLNDSQQNIGVCTNVLKSIEKAPSCSNGEAFQFTIPTLKACNNGQKLFGGSTTEANASSSNINQFLMKQLGDQQSDRFNVPTLQKGSANGFIIPVLKTTNPCQNARSTIVSPALQNSITIPNQDHQTDVKHEDHIIDLTTALSFTTIGSENINQRSKAQLEAFEIPFIECDRQQQLPPQVDDYCQIDVSRVQFQHSLASPSTLGRILSNNVKRRKRSKVIVQQTQQLNFKAKQNIERFLFDTKSPDDLVLAALNRFTRSQ